MMGLHDYLKTISLIVLTVHVIYDTIVVVEAQNTQFSYLYFSSPEEFLTMDDVQYYPGNSSFLMNTRGYSLSIGTCGRLLYKNRVRMKDAASGAVASFHTAFTFSITGLDYYTYDDITYFHGDGLAFTFASINTLLGQTSGSALCLLQEVYNGQASNRLFAVEFDTFRNYWWNDPSDNHIGINNNSMNSTWSYNLCGGNAVNCTYLCNGGFFTTWIDYNSSSQKLDLFFANGSLQNNIPKPTKPLIEATLPLTDLLEDFMYVGFSASVGSFQEVHTIQSWQFASSGMPEQDAVQPNPGTSNSAASSNGRTVRIIAGVCVGVGAALLLAGFSIAKYRWRSSDMKQGKFNLVDQNLVPRIFAYKELSKATQNFSKGELLGCGGFGAVYRGTLPSGGLVAVKRMRLEEGFQAEARSLSQIRHRNLVQLRGWCHEEDQLLLVYDYMCNGNLDDWLFRFAHQTGKERLNLNAAEALPLTLRHSILSGVAAALSYLHEECKQCVLHRDIKSSNVLLDDDLNAYLGDFGLARLIDHQKIEKTTMMAGTLGYMGPEMPHTGKATKETDVYSFGVLMLEVMSGIRPLNMSTIEQGDGVLVERAWRAHEAGDLLQMADSKLGTLPHSDAASGSYAGFESQEAPGILITEDVHDFDPSEISAPDAAMEDKKMVANLLHLGLLCCNPNPEDRPSMRLVSQLLQAAENMEMSLPPLPRCKPQARYCRPVFSELARRPSCSSSYSVLNVHEAEKGSSQSTPLCVVSSGEKADMQMFFASNSSSVLTGR